MSERFTPSDLQAKAIREIKDWFLHRTHEQQVFRVFGYAGRRKDHHHPACHRRARARHDDEEHRSGACLARRRAMPRSPARRRWS